MNSYTKLKSGAWGVRVVGPVSPGQTVSVWTKAGKQKEETITKVVWSGDGIYLCAIAGSEPKSSPCCASGSRQVCADCGKPGNLVPDMEDGLLKHPGCCDMEPY